jgi:hypothetical protein
MVSRWLAPPTSATVLMPSLRLQTKEPKAGDPDERFRRLVLGTWADDYEGKRTMADENAIKVYDEAGKLLKAVNLETASDEKRAA